MGAAAIDGEHSCAALDRPAEEKGVESSGQVAARPGGFYRDGA